jgi:hypothetical protein
MFDNKSKHALYLGDLYGVIGEKQLEMCETVFPSH